MLPLSRVSSVAVLCPLYFSRLFLAFVSVSVCALCGGVFVRMCKFCIQELVRDYAKIARGCLSACLPACLPVCLSVCLQIVVDSARTWFGSQLNAAFSDPRLEARPSLPLSDSRRLSRTRAHTLVFAMPSPLSRACA